MRFEFETARGSRPLYLQLANALEAHIVENGLLPGTLLPSEPTLAAENTLSRATIMKAFEVLIDRGLVERRRGKGTFVRSRPMERKLPELSSFSDHIQSLGLAPSSRLISFETFAAGNLDRPKAPFPDALDLVVIQRIRSVDGTPVGLQRLIIAEHLAARIGLDETAAARTDFSFYGMLSDAGIYLNSGEETLRAINATKSEAVALDVQPGEALIEVDRSSHDASGQLIENVRARYLGTHYLYRVTLNSPSNGGNNETKSDLATRTGGGFAAGIDRVLDGSR